MKTDNNPFPTLIRTAPGRWEGDGRTVQVLAIKGRTGYTVTLDGEDQHYDSTQQVLAVLSRIPPMRGNYHRPKASSSHANWSTAGGIKPRRVLTGKGSGAEY